MPGEGRAEVLRARVSGAGGFKRREQGERGGEEAEGEGNSICTRNLTRPTGTNLTVVEGINQYIMYILYVVQPVRVRCSFRRG